MGEGTAAIAPTAVGASNTLLHGNTGADPTFSAVDLTADVTGVLPIANGGSGTGTLTAHGVLLGEGSGAFGVTAAGATLQVLTGVTGADPVWSASPSLTGLTVASPTLFVDSVNHRVGIGTTGPTDKLHVVGIANSYAAYIDNPAAAGTSFGFLVDAGSNSSDAAMRVRSTTGTDFLFVRGDGNVGIGTTGPGAKLHTAFAGNSKIRIESLGSGGFAGLDLRADASGTNRTAVVDLDQANNLIRFGLGGVIYASLLSTGVLSIPNAVGLNTTVPDGKLTAVITGNTNNNGLTLRDTNFPGAVNGWNIDADNSTTGDLYFKSVVANSFSIVTTWQRATGNVGIGITPTAALHVKAGAAAANSAPVKLTSGPLMTVAEAGAIEFLTDTFYGTTTTGPTRKAFAMIDAASVGAPGEMAKIDSTGLTANVAASTLYAVPATGEGFYRVNAYVVETVAGSVSSVLPNVQIIYTDKDSNVSVTIDATPILGAAGLGQTGALNANAGGTVSSGVIVIYVKASTTIQYSTSNYASVAAGMTYALRIRLELL
jgi:hypothetical protein